MTSPETAPSRTGAPRVRQVPHVVVVGAGLAGLTAACALADDGIAVTVLEARSRLGGATFSFRRDAPGGPLVVDNGQHVLLRCYERYLALLQRLGTADRVRFQPRLRIPVRTPDGGCAVLERVALPPPAHLAGAVARYRLLRPGERVRALRAAAELTVRLDPADPRLDTVCFADWLADRRQGPGARHALWDLLCVAALNARPEDASLALAAMVFRTAFGSRAADHGDLGIPDVPLNELHVDPAERRLVARGARVLRRSAARGLLRTPDGWVVRYGSGRGQRHELRCDGVVLAVPPATAARLAPPGAGLDRAALTGLGDSPIVSVHLWLDRPVLTEPFTAAVGTPISWIFARSAARPRAPQYLTIPISAAQDWIDRPVDDIRDEVVPALRGLLPAAGDAQVCDVFVTRERRATFRQRPGTGRLRPPARTRLPGLVLAGAWTATGWPDTLEGAVRSGEAAAAALRLESRAGPGEPGSDPSPKPGGEARR